MGRRLEEKVVLVTGGASGIGFSTAMLSAREGAKVVVADILAKEGQQTVKMIQEAGGQALFVEADVSNAVQVEAMIKKTVETYGRLDCAFNNAGVGSRGPTVPIIGETEEDFDRFMATNLKGVWLCMKYEIIQMSEQGGGVIVNNSSVAGLRGNFIDSPLYIASKHGVGGLTTTAALHFAEKNIRINAVCPGFTLTPLAENALKSRPEIDAYMKQLVPLKRWATPEEIGETVVWLCSDAAAYITGQNIVVDGGMLAR